MTMTETPATTTRRLSTAKAVAEGIAQEMERDPACLLYTSDAADE